MTVCDIKGDRVGEQKGGKIPIAKIPGWKIPVGKILGGKIVGGKIVGTQMKDSREDYFLFSIKFLNSSLLSFPSF